MLADYPFAIVKYRDKFIRRIIRQKQIFTTVLTTNMSRCFKSSRHLRVHGDHDLLFFAHQCITLLNLLRDPFLELITQNSRNCVDEPLLWDFWHVDLVWEVHEHVRLVDDELEDLFDGEVLVLRHVNCLDLVVVDVRFPPGQDILKEIYRDVVIRREIDLTLTGEKRVTLSMMITSVSQKTPDTYLLDLNFAAKAFAETC